jgi:hypothetical protein
MGAEVADAAAAAAPYSGLAAAAPYSGLAAAAPYSGLAAADADAESPGAQYQAAESCFEQQMLQLLLHEHIRASYRSEPVAEA